MLTLAVQNADVLRALAAAHEDDTPAKVADGLGRDRSNFAKTLAALRREGLMRKEGLALTDAARELLPRLDVLEGVTSIPDGVVALTHDQLAPSPLNPRKDWSSDEADAALDALRQSILQHGLQQNLVVRAEPEANGVRFIVAGESRWRAIRAAIEDGDLPESFPIPCRLQHLTEEEHEDLAMIENLVRRDLHPLEEATAFARWRDRGRSTTDSADMIGRTARHVQERIKLLELRPGDRARMRLPKDDPQHLTLTGARLLLQQAKPLVALADSQDPEDRAEWDRRLAAPDGGADQVDIEEVAPRSTVELTEDLALILFEVEAAVKARPEKATLGPTTKLASFPNLLAEDDRDARKLVGEGMLSFSGNYPATVTLLAPGMRWLAAQGGAFMPDEFRLQQARRAVLTDTLIGELEASGDYATAWLNVPKPAPPPALSDDEALILLEVLDADGQKNHGAYATAQVRGDGAPALRALVERGLLHKPYPGQGDGYLRTSVPPLAITALEGRFGGVKGDAKRRAAIARMRESTKRWPGRTTPDPDKPLDAGAEEPYATPWLNGPFKVDRAWREEHDAREAERTKAEQERAAMKAAHDKLHDQVTEFEREAADMTPSGRQARLVKLLRAANAPAPWRPNLDTRYYDSPDAWAANEVGIKRTSAVCNRLQFIALNMAAGVAPADWPPTSREVVEAVTNEGEDAGEDEESDDG